MTADIHLSGRKRLEKREKNGALFLTLEKPVTCSHRLKDWKASRFHLPLHAIGLGFFSLHFLLTIAIFECSRLPVCNLFLSFGFAKSMGEDAIRIHLQKSSAISMSESKCPSSPVTLSMDCVWTEAQALTDTLRVPFRSDFNLFFLLSYPFSIYYCIHTNV